MTLTVTLNDLVDAVSEFAHSDAEVVATVMHMLKKGRIHPAGDGGETRSARRAHVLAPVVHH
jgi:hypothetical protein